MPLARDYGFVPVNIPTIKLGDFILTTLMTDDGDLAAALNFLSRKAVYPLNSYPQMRDLWVMLKQLQPGEQWTGHEFFAYTDAYHRPNEVTEPGSSGVFAPTVHSAVDADVITSKATAKCPENIQNQYDSNGNLLWTTDPLGNSILYAYDSSGDVTTQFQPLSTTVAATTTYTYNSLGEVLTMTDPLGNVTTNTYDSHRQSALDHHAQAEQQHQCQRHAICL
jgi:YD repeat-containing protein